jgi:hypothetical protein
METFTHAEEPTDRDVDYLRYEAARKRQQAIGLPLSPADTSNGSDTDVDLDLDADVEANAGKH